MSREADALLAAIPEKAHVIALDNRGAGWSTEQVAEQLERWQALGKSLVLLIGGADGLHPRCRERADQMWSLSPLTFPHPLVRVVLAEQLYRAQVAAGQSSLSPGLKWCPVDSIESLASASAASHAEQLLQTDRL